MRTVPEKTSGQTDTEANRSKDRGHFIGPFHFVGPGKATTAFADCTCLTNEQMRVEVDRCTRNKYTCVE